MRNNWGKLEYFELSLGSEYRKLELGLKDLSVVLKFMQVTDGIMSAVWLE